MNRETSVLITLFFFAAMPISTMTSETVQFKLIIFISWIHFGTVTYSNSNFLIVFSRLCLRQRLRNILHWVECSTLMFIMLFITFYWWYTLEVSLIIRLICHFIFMPLFIIRYLAYWTCGQNLKIWNKAGSKVLLNNSILFIFISKNKKSLMLICYLQCFGKPLLNQQYFHISVFILYLFPPSHVCVYCVIQ